MLQLKNLKMSFSTVVLTIFLFLTMSSENAHQV
jgi:hypothetical protein